MVSIERVLDFREVYDFMAKMAFPYRYKADYAAWERSYSQDIDGAGRALFTGLETAGAYRGGRLIGLIQYGETAFGFDRHGEVSPAVSYPVIRNFFFSEGEADAGKALLREAINALSGTSRIYAFFHYFGMSCYARHGKLYEGFGEIHELLLESGFCIEHENVFYSCALKNGLPPEAPVVLKWHEETPGRQRYCDFLLDHAVVGGCEVHFLEQADVAYLRWIFVNEALCGKGIGTQAMNALKAALYAAGITQLDTDTALTNGGAQRFYEKNGFAKRGLTRSYYSDSPFCPRKSSCPEQ